MKRALIAATLFLWLGTSPVVLATTIGRGMAFSSFQEVLGLHAGSSTVARAIWKNAKTGTQIMTASYGR